jgi:glycosyltransferase involved in cell wall biosynthesis
MDAVCCLVSGLLGNARMSERLIEAVELSSPRPPRVVWFDAESYRRFPVPRFLRLSQELEAELVIRRMLRDSPLPRARAYVVNTFHLGMAAHRRELAGRWIVATDATPAMTLRLRAAGYGAQLGLVRRTFRQVQHSRFTAFAPAVDRWLAISDACRDSLVEDYGVDPARCAVTRAPQPDIDPVLSGRDPGARPWRLIFVGNDFARKGGPMLCAAVARLPDTALTIVSSDPLALQFAGPRVRVVSGLRHLRELAPLYRAAHLLVHPTFVDHYSNVICEGLARGLPFLVSDLTPAAELVRSSGAGRTLDGPPSGDSIAQAVQRWMDEPEAHLVAQQNALRYARESLSMERFRVAIQAALDGRAHAASVSAA